MAEFEFLQNQTSKKWVVVAPRRAKRPDMAKGTEPVCPFCLGREKDEAESYRVGGTPPDSDWQIRVIPNKFPFAPIHEIIIHSPDHHKNFGELPLSQVELILSTYRQRYQTHKDKGQVYIFHNRGEAGGESLPHPHTQIAVVPLDVRLDIPRLATERDLPQGSEEEVQETDHFTLFCPRMSQWPDEVWIAPKKGGRAFGEITDTEVVDLADILTRLVQIFDLRHGHEFPFNFYIYPGGNWYLRLIPRVKTLGGFEIGTGVYVNTQLPIETIRFVREHFQNPNHEKIRNEHQASYEKRV